jgi:hypothetical protein
MGSDIPPFLYAFYLRLLNTFQLNLMLVVCAKSCGNLMFISAHDRKWDVVGFNRKGTSLQIVSRLHNTLIYMIMINNVIIETFVYGKWRNTKTRIQNK